MHEGHEVRWRATGQTAEHRARCACTQPRAMLNSSMSPIQNPTKARDQRNLLTVKTQASQVSCPYVHQQACDPARRIAIHSVLVPILTPFTLAPQHCCVGSCNTHAGVYCIVVHHLAVTILSCRKHSKTHSPFTQKNGHSGFSVSVLAPEAEAAVAAPGGAKGTHLLTLS